MEVSYELTLDDLLAFADHANRTSRRAKRMKIAIYAAVPVVFTIAAAQYYWDYREIDLFFLVLIACAPASLIVLPRMFSAEVAAACRHFITHPRAADTGSVRLIADDSGLLEIAPLRQTQRRWDQLRYIEETERYLYLFDSPRDAFIIPRSSIAVGIYEQLKAQILTHAPKGLTRRCS